MNSTTDKSILAKTVYLLGEWIIELIKARKAKPGAGQMDIFGGIVKPKKPKAAKVAADAAKPGKPSKAVVKLSAADKQEVKNPGIRGGHFWRDKQGRIHYGQAPGQMELKERGGKKYDKPGVKTKEPEEPKMTAQDVIRHLESKTLPDLQGSAKQIKWAHSLRENDLNNVTKELSKIDPEYVIDGILDAYAPDGTKKKHVDSFWSDMKSAVDRVFDDDRAAYWINNRSKHSLTVVEGAYNDIIKQSNEKRARSLMDNATDIQFPNGRKVYFFGKDYAVFLNGNEHMESYEYIPEVGETRVLFTGAMTDHDFPDQVVTLPGGAEVALRVIWHGSPPASIGRFMPQGHVEYRLTRNK